MRASTLDQLRDKIKVPKVTLVTSTGLPLESVYSVWESSKGTGEFRSPEWVRDNVAPEVVRERFRAVIRQRIPIGEHIDFVFMLEQVSISLREHAVRHRIGVTVSPERLAHDIGMLDVRSIPDRPDSSFWSQSMRIMDMSAFADNMDFRVPDTIINHPTHAAYLFSLYLKSIITAQESYAALVAAGVPFEDARELIPVGAQSRFSWRLNISSLQHIIGERGCWILQLGLWGPVIQGMVAELVAKVDPIFAEMVSPPCLDGDSDKFKGCAYMEENRRRYSGEDAHAPCPLHFAHHQLAATSDGHPDDPQTQLANETPVDEAYVAQAPMGGLSTTTARLGDYEKFWNRDVYSGRRLRVIGD